MPVRIDIINVRELISFQQRGREDTEMLSAIFEMVEKILEIAGASIDAQAIVQAIFDAILGFFG